MKVLHFSTTDDGGGAAKAAVRLHRSLLQRGVASSIAVQKSTGSEAGVRGPSSRIDKAVALARPYLDSLPTRLCAPKPLGMFSPAYVPGRMLNAVREYAPSVANLHWVANGFLRIETLRRFGTPIVWTLHDSWGFTGGCHLPGECIRYRDACGRCPVLNSDAEVDLSSWVLRRKSRSWRDLSLAVIAPSEWLASCARASAVFKGALIRTIPNGVDIDVYRPLPRQVAREVLGIPPNRPVILFSAAGGGRDPNKGLRLLLDALGALKTRGQAREWLLLVAGGYALPPGLPDPVECRFLGRLHDDISMVVANAASDVVVVPSIQENLSNVVLEALACGRPVVAFQVGGMPDMIVDEVNGALARPFDVVHLAEKLAATLSDPIRWAAMSVAARAVATDRFSLTLQAERYHQLYDEVLAAAHEAGRAEERTL